MHKSLKFWLGFIFLGSFSILLYMGVAIVQDKPPIPKSVFSDSGAVLFTEQDIMAGQQLALNHQLQDYGTILGHGAYFGPDFTALAIESSRKTYERENLSEKEIKSLFQTNTFDFSTQNLKLQKWQTQAYLEYRNDFVNKSIEKFRKDGVLFNATPQELSQMASYFFWTAWTATTRRPNQSYSYTNNWPYVPGSYNELSPDSVVYSALSVGVLVLGVSLLTLIYFRGRFFGEETHEKPAPMSLWKPTVSQSKTFKFFVLAGILFLVQSILGGMMAHSYVEPEGFYGFPIYDIFPFQLVRGLHLQLAIFWIALCFLGMGIFLAPMIGGKEPPKQGLMVDILFYAVVFVAVGSILGQVLSIMNFVPKGGLFTSDGWEYMELGYGWRVLLFGGLMFFSAIVLRGVWPRLKMEKDRLGLVHLFAYAAIGMSLVYATALLFDARSHVSIAEYWRWWVIHLWVEGTFEVFAVVTMGTLFVGMGLLKTQSTARAVQFQICIIMGSGIIGTGHHLYFTGSPAWLIGLAACFSALEVVPLCLLCVEAWDQYKQLQLSEQDFVYKPVFWCLISVALWNMFGAGVLGFLINQPMVSFYEMGTWLTAAHGHGALMGVYGFLSLAMMFFVQAGTGQSIRANFEKTNLRAILWLNAGLFLMVVLIVVPVGLLQLEAVVEKGYVFARSREFYSLPVIEFFLWFRMLPDLIFITGVFFLNLSLLKTVFLLKDRNEAESQEQVKLPERFTAL